MTTCTSCGKPLARADRFCPNCGTPRSDPPSNRIEGSVTVTNAAAGVKAVGVLIERLIGDAHITTVVQTHAKLILGGATVLLLAIAFVGYLVQLGWGPRRMAGPFTVAVTEFGELDEQGRVRASEDGRDMSHTVFRALRAEATAMPEFIRPTVWHDSMPRDIKGIRLGLLPGAVLGERDRAAAALARRVCADMVVSGLLHSVNGVVHVQPEFHIADDDECGIRLPQGPGELDDIVGQHQYGSPIEVGAQSRRDLAGWKEKATRALGERQKALARIIAALFYETQGDTAQALEILRERDEEHDEERHEEAWADPKVQALWSLFLGRLSQQESERFRRIAKDTSKPEEERREAGARADALREEALGHFTAAKTIDPDFARAYVGLGNYHYDLAIGTRPEERLPALSVATDAYLRAAAGAEAQGDERTELKARLSLAQAYLLSGEALLRRGDGDAGASHLATSFDQSSWVLDRAEGRAHGLRARAHLTQGQIHRLRRHVAQERKDDAVARQELSAALDAFDACLQHAEAQTESSLTESEFLRRCATAREDTLSEAKDS